MKTRQQAKIEAAKKSRVDPSRAIFVRETATAFLFVTYLRYGSRTTDVEIAK